jgi:hypothetical protein
VSPAQRPPRSQAGAALLTVLTVLVALGIVVSIIADRMRGDARPWLSRAADVQALYIAESGIAYQLYLERWSDSSEPSFGKPLPGDSTGEGADSGPAFGEPLGSLLKAGKAPTDTFRFRMDTTLEEPRVRVDRTRSWLDMTSVGTYRNAQATVWARFGKALDDSIFGPALTLDNDQVVEPFPADRVAGLMRIRQPAPGMATLPFLHGFSVTAYAAEFTDRTYNALDEAMRKRLSDPAAEKGNGHFTPRDRPKFGKGGNLVFAMGSVDFTNDGREAWIIKGPGRIYSDGEIRVKGNIRLENIQLLSGKDITFEDSVSGEGISAFARGSVYLHDRCRMEIEAVAGRDIVLRDKAQTLIGSVLLSAGAKRIPPGDSLNAIRVVNEAVGRGFLIAAGANGRLAMATAANRIEGVVIASSVWLAGEVDGPVVARKLLCEGTNARNCLGPGRIYRNRLPEGFVQPLQLGPQDRRTYVYKLMAWRRS